LYVPTPKYSGNGIKRMKNMITYCLGLKKFRKHDNQPDLIVICEAYLFSFVRRIYKKKPVICDIVDLWPLSIIEYSSISKRNPIIKMLYALEKQAYIKSNALIFSMEGGTDYIRETKYANKINFDRVFHINMGSDLSEFDKNDNCIYEMVRNKKNFTVTYCGSMRTANNIIQICEAANIIKEKGLNQIKIEFYGNGPDEDSAKNYCQENKLDNVKFHGRFQKNQLSEILSRTDATIMTYKKSRVMKYGGSQSKLFDYMSSGKPIINCGDWGYNLVSRYRCGIVVKEQTSENIAVAIQQLFEMPNNEIDEMGKRARNVAEMYDQPTLVDQLSEILDIVLLEKM
jgi:glycosyltransferase involved in cell wall biosynthesis